MSVVSRCHSTGDKEIRRALDIISIEMRLSPSLSRSACTTVLARTPARGSSHCATFSTCKWQCHQTLSFHQSSQGGHEYTKGERGGSATSRSFAWPNYKAILSLSLSVPCFPRALFVFILKGMVTFSRRLKQGQAWWPLSKETANASTSWIANVISLFRHNFWGLATWVVR